MIAVFWVCSAPIASGVPRSSVRDLPTHPMLRLARQFHAKARPFPTRTHSCAQLSADLDGAPVTLAGWLLPERKGRLVSFFPLKDSQGTTQLVVNHAENPDAAAVLASVPPESTVLVQGTVALRPQSARRPGPTGDIDVRVQRVTVLNPATDMPFLPHNIHNLVHLAAPLFLKSELISASQTKTSEPAIGF